MDFLKKAKKKAQEFSDEHGLDLNLDKIKLGDEPSGGGAAVAGRESVPGACAIDGT